MTTYLITTAFLNFLAGILLAVLGLVVVNALAESPWGLFTIAATMLRVMNIMTSRIRLMMRVEPR